MKNFRNKYKCLSEGNSTYGCLHGLAKLGLFTKVSSENTIYTSRSLFAEVEDSLFAKNKGGIIAFATDNDAAKTEIAEWFKVNYQSAICLANNTPTSKLEPVIYTIGHALIGKYVANDENHTYCKQSLTIEILGIKPEVLFQLAEKLCCEFKQKNILVKDYSNQRFYLVNDER